MSANKELADYKRTLRTYLKKLKPIFAKASIGDFSEDVAIPGDDNELTIFFVGVQIILDAIREKEKETAEAFSRLHEANIQLAHDKALYEAILSSAAEGMIAVDKQGRITLINQAAADMLGLDAKVVIGVNYYDLIVTKNRDGQVVPVEERPLSQALRKGEKHITSLADGLQYATSSGKLLPVAITASPIKLRGDIAGGVSTFRDISEEKQLDRTKSEIISIASHQLRTPLTAIKWISEQLTSPKSRFSRSKHKQYVNQIYSSNERMIALVNDLLNVSRIELGTLSLSPKPFELKHMIDDILRELSSLVKAKHLKVSTHIAKGLQEITTDPRYLQVITQNLLSNAVKYSPDRQAVIIHAEKHAGNLVISIKDHGCGIPADQQDKIFSKLFRADNARKLVSEGSGLGLYVCKAMVGQLGGKIWFESTENKGSTFYAQIPLAAAEPSPAAT